MNTSGSVQYVFVYGTLKRRQCRERAWPRQPLAIVPAWTSGDLYDLGPYPALVKGSGRVQGELWLFTPSDLPQTLDVLDRIEGFANRSDDLYRREIANCSPVDGPSVLAFTYHYARTLPREAKLIAAGPSGFCSWPPTEE